MFRSLCAYAECGLFFGVGHYVDFLFKPAGASRGIVGHTYCECVAGGNGMGGVLRPCASAVGARRYHHKRLVAGIDGPKKTCDASQTLVECSEIMDFIYPFGFRAGFLFVVERC